MEIVFLGGASGVGASCTAVRLGQRWLLIDAGVRLGREADRLPDLAFLEGKQLAAVLITHAHADHIGALPLVYQAFPNTPIYASQATIQLMEVMLADALQIMSRRAVEELEVPLFDDALVAGTLRQLRPLPIGGQTSLPELPELRLSTSRAGHIAGAISLGLEHPDGRLVVSGDVSLTAQRSVQGAALPSLRRPDLLILESTYGTRLHPNRQAEEHRLAQAIAAGVARGGHVLIPAFALGRAQEVLLIVQDAQRRGQIPEFPVWIDGLVRSVCAAYRAIPEALTPALQRRIARGQNPFTGPNVRAVERPDQRAAILAGPPCCIVASSGMLTGGPSALYAARLAEREEATILITGYQDEEAPGRRLLDLADQRSGTLELGGAVVQVRCQVAKYALSAHADGGELAALVQALQPQQVALVHGDEAARLGLAQQLRDTTVLLPTEGQALHIVPHRRAAPAPLDAQTAPAHGLGDGLALRAADLPRLADFVRRSSKLGAATVSIRSLALLWYGLEADEQAEQEVQRALAAHPELFAPVADAPGLYTVDAPGQAAVGAGTVVLARIDGVSLLPFLCIDRLQAALVGVLPEGKGQRTRVPVAEVQTVVGRWPEQPIGDVLQARRSLLLLMEQGRRLRRTLPAAAIAQGAPQEGSHTLDELLEALGQPHDDLALRLHVARALHSEHRLFQVAQPLRVDDGAPARYTLAEGWQRALAEGAGLERPDSSALQAIIDRHLGGAADLHRRSIDPESGAITLAFHFPDVARERYAALIAAVETEAGVPVEIAPQAHQGALVKLARQLAPPGLQFPDNPALYPNERRIHATCRGRIEPDQLARLQADFAAATGWALQISQPGPPRQSRIQIEPPVAQGARMAQQLALDLARTLLKDIALKIGVQDGARNLIVRFPLPQVDAERFRPQLIEVAERTGWGVVVHPEPQHTALNTVLQHVLPPGIQQVGHPSLHSDRCEIALKVAGAASEDELAAAQEQFAAATGWLLVLHRQPAA